MTAAGPPTATGAIEFEWQPAADGHAKASAIVFVVSAVDDRRRVATDIFLDGRRGRFHGDCDGIGNTNVTDIAGVVGGIEFELIFTDAKRRKFQCPTAVLRTESLVLAQRIALAVERDIKRSGISFGPGA